MPNNQNILLQKHKELDYKCRNRNGKPFISDWYCEHPFVNEVIPKETRGNVNDLTLCDYYYQNDRNILHEKIIDFHHEKQEINYCKEQVFISAGLSALITAQLILLLRRNIKKIYYIKPIYYTYYFLAESFGINLIPINSNTLISKEIQLSLPKEKNTALIICDPIWFMGKYNNEKYIEIIYKWQEKYKNIVLVDGAFQYQRWANNDLPENTSKLHPDFTLRNICPTKTVAMHGPRFSYCLAPNNMMEEIRYCYSNTAGAGSIFDFDASVQIMDWLNSSSSVNNILKYIKERYSFLIKLGLIKDTLGANSSYFCFIENSFIDDTCIFMDQLFFDSTEFPNMVRFNLLLPGDELMEFIKIVMSKKHFLEKEKEEIHMFFKELK